MQIIDQMCILCIEIVDIECVVGNLAGTQIEKYKYKSAILDLSEERFMRNTMGRV